MNALVNFRKSRLRIVFVFLFLTVLIAYPNSSGADEGEKIIKEKQCTSCHRFSGKPDSKFKLRAPDLMWGGVKYQRGWLLRWLEGKEEPLYPNGYRWDSKSNENKHVKLTPAEAEKVADYMEKTLKDPRVKKGAIDLSKFTEMERDFGADIYKKYSCFGCHQIMEDGKKAGGPISTTLYGAGKRYNVDWLARFAANPQDFTPHSGEYLADLSALGGRYIVGYVMTLGVDDYKFYEPWKSEYFQKSDPERGEKTYREYCTQCHGMKGEGDGPGAAGLDPKPAIHAKMPLSDMPVDYLYNVVYYGGKSVGKSSSMPDWGLTLPPQDFADLIAYLRATFKGQ